ncbi:MAG: hypothetical protein LUQ65_08120 [Candidatus Helarchaeota archaeon]|nr:hypothetical protein [Candidatus Helarchaeota archaeon]
MSAQELDSPAHKQPGCLIQSGLIKKYSQALNELTGNTLVSIDMEYPILFQRKVFLSPVTLAGIILKWMIKNMAAKSIDDFESGIGTPRIQHKYL